MKYKFGDGTASKKIVQTIKNNLNNTNKLLLKELDFPY
jgi:UDP-N-acetylglucosamine 2-epimerase